MTLLVITAAMLSGCFGEKQVLEELGADGAGTLKVVYADEESFYSRYGNAFQVKYPGIEIEVVSWGEMHRELRDKDDADMKAERLEFLRKHKPDVVIVSLDEMGEMAQEGKLYNLDAVIAQEKFDLEGYMPGLIDMIRGKGSGSLYGLAPEFGTSAIYYNADLFREHHIDPPRHQMTWEELLELSSRFKGLGSRENQIAGYYERNGKPDQLLLRMADAYALRLFDAKGEKLMFETDGWKRAMKLAADSIRNQSAYMQPPIEDEQGNLLWGSDSLFFQGKAAMIMEETWFMSDLKHRPAWDKEAKSFDWGIVTAPVDPASPDSSPYVRLHQVFAIAADSPNKRAAWEFVKFVNGPDTAKANSRKTRETLPTRIHLVEEIDGKSLEAFYLLRPRAQSKSIWDDFNLGLPRAREFFWEFRMMLSREMEAVIGEKKTVDEAAAAVQAEGQAVLRKVREEEKARRLTPEDNGQ
ncbi:ABC transporter substrate-binding protein [Paenibacillus dendritiformis]|uniref:ABC transporter substrate-binding protein n=1 Tax=Paenibacillus dendritiformis TaxID=130049 RepID=UPI00387E182D